MLAQYEIVKILQEFARAKFWYFVIMANFLTYSFLKKRKKRTWTSYETKQIFFTTVAFAIFHRLQTKRNKQS